MKLQQHVIIANTIPGGGGAVWGNIFLFDMYWINTEAAAKRERGPQRLRVITSMRIDVFAQTAHR